MTDMTYNDMITMVRNHAKATNQSRFVINTVKASDNTYSKNKDKDGLDRADRARIEAVKDRQTYPVDGDLW